MPGNSCTASGDLQSVRCEQAREALSARLDGEEPGVDPVLLEEHLRGCADCSTWSDRAADAARPLRLQRVDAAAPDLTQAVVQALRERPAAPPRRVARAALVVTALLHVLLSVPTLLGDADHHGALHAAREGGVTDLALALGVLAAAWRPWRAAGMLPVVTALAVGLAATSALDLATGSTTALAEVPHLLALVEAGLLWRLRHAGATRPVAPEPVALRRVA